jgi:hypothetical protein
MWSKRNGLAQQEMEKKKKKKKEKREKNVKTSSRISFSVRFFFLLSFSLHCLFFLILVTLILGLVTT